MPTTLTDKPAIRRRGGNGVDALEDAGSTGLATKDFIDTFLQRYPEKVLKSLLWDKTTKRNIIWADNEYEQLGAGYGMYDEITLDRITGEHSDLIMPRTEKDAESQAARTRTHAEVFTPSWLCCRMNDDIDEQWFGRPQAFTIMDGDTWAATPMPVEFGELDWHDYVDCLRLEITCGEAPFICSRYDTVTGQPLPVESRIGFLDRKLRVVSENANDYIMWRKYAYRALESTYGYEYQGDNLLVARINVLETFVEHMQARWNKEPDLSEIQHVANIIAWNLWQMDGFTDTPPSSVPVREIEPMDLFDTIDDPIEEKAKPCLIYDWRKRRPQTFASLKKSKGV
ncbi:type II DNA modification methyltransferase family protein [Bifidobacterium vansinderenii]|uniref:Type II DNA modification methyltransferase family protein n=1 Tax=Bifidobacterium vansinderenii TaxID=1984871 RepID=A0A229VZP7_9BIFI|nr:type II DNA modification methyltransferase family protein [Bifidobacterium vansinderenii]